MCRRLREAVRDGHFTVQLGGECKMVEIDETFVGGLEKNKHRSKRPTSERAELAGKRCSLSSSGTARFVLTISGR
jgi:hypothetical protein